MAFWHSGAHICHEIRLHYEITLMHEIRLYNIVIHAHVRAPTSTHLNLIIKMRMDVCVPVGARICQNRYIDIYVWLGSISGKLYATQIKCENVVILTVFDALFL